MLKSNCLWVHLPHFDWRLLMDDDTSQLFPNLLDLIHTGTSGCFRRSATNIITEGILLTGMTPEKSNIVTAKCNRPDGYGITDLCRPGVTAPFFWEYLDAAGIPCVAINMLGSHFSKSEVGLVLSDAFCRVTDSDADNWPLSPGSVSNLARTAKMSQLRWHPSQISEADLTWFFNNDLQQLQTFGSKSLARMVCETSSVHAAATQAIEDQSFVCHFVRYTLLQDLAFSLAKQPLRSLPVYRNAAMLIDGLVGRLVQLMQTKTTVVITASEPAPFAIICADAVGRDALFDKNMGIYDVLPTVARVLGVSAAKWAGTAYCLAQPGSTSDWQPDMQLNLPQSVGNINLDARFPPSRTQQKDIQGLQMARWTTLAQHFALMGDGKAWEMIKQLESEGLIQDQLQPLTDFVSKHVKNPKQA
ncbi:hypothetical protein [Bowmanella sp. JS7-9]|uniref:Uncharacterized protein n=1 Tax=Pseudobowmanella zhangzhouensis TaxID=1537679 RepID=A0ABW1XN47_9ALTE|nr:hypothetical protein [Bowmanella sp. JS7-9]TBX20374.1 hypothetical protein TK45_15410 [Bowmanella sp. JS7-9]